MSDWAQEGADEFQEREQERDDMAQDERRSRAISNVKRWETRAQEEKDERRRARAIKNADRWVTIWLKIKHETRASA